MRVLMGADPARQEQEARHPGRGRPDSGRVPISAPSRRLGRDGAPARRRRGGDRLVPSEDERGTRPSGRRTTCVLTYGTSVRGARAAQLLVQQPVRRVPDCDGIGPARGRRRPGRTRTDRSVAERATSACPTARSQFFYPELLESVSKYFGIDMDKAVVEVEQGATASLLLNGT